MLEKMRSDFVMYGIGLTIVLVVGWAAWEKHVENDRLYLSPAEQVHQREQAFHSDLGALRAEVTTYKKEVDNLESKLTEAQKEAAAANGRVDVMRDYFQKYSPEAFEKVVKTLQKNVDELENEMTDFARYDARYAGKNVIDAIQNQIKHLPNGWQWEQHKKKLDEEFIKIENLTKRLNKLEGKPDPKIDPKPKEPELEEPPPE